MHEITLDQRERARKSLLRLTEDGLGDGLSVRLEAAKTLLADIAAEAAIEALKEEQ